MSAEDPMVAVRQYIDAFNKGDAMGMAATFAVPGAILDGMAPQTSVRKEAAASYGGCPSLWLWSAGSELSVGLAQIGDRHRHLIGGLIDNSAPGQEAVPSVQDEDIWILIDIAGFK